MPIIDNVRQPNLNRYSGSQTSLCLIAVITILHCHCSVNFSMFLTLWPQPYHIVVLVIFCEYSSHAKCLTQLSLVQRQWKIVANQIRLLLFISSISSVLPTLPGSGNFLHCLIILYFYVTFIHKGKQEARTKDTWVPQLTKQEVRKCARSITVLARSFWCRFCIFIFVKFAFMFSYSFQLFFETFFALTNIFRVTLDMRSERLVGL